jgi:hypothetical protein
MITAPNPRAVFFATIITGSFLLFLVQPMVARLALPLVGGAPSVWNSAMLTYQTLLLAGYGYALWLSNKPLKFQAVIHIGLLVLAALTLPIALRDWVPSRPGLEAIFIPLLLLVSIGPVFGLVSAQAPLMQRWYVADPAAGEPWWLYSISNFGSFAGLLVYPLLVEPLFSTRAQVWAWSIGFCVLIVLVCLSAWTRRNVAAAPLAPAAGPAAKQGPIGRGRIALWLALSAVPSGLMLSTTTHLTTDIVAMPLLWVIPLALYLLSFIAAFANRQTAARLVVFITPTLMLLGARVMMSSRQQSSVYLLLLTLVLLFAICTALHSRLYSLRPHYSLLTKFYFYMSLGGALGGAFTALVAPLVFNWAWEHPLLLLAAALLVPLPVVFDWPARFGISASRARLLAIGLAAGGMILCVQLLGLTTVRGAPGMESALVAVIALIALACLAWRAVFVALLCGLVLAQGGVETIVSLAKSDARRSYFGIYRIQDNPVNHSREMMHGTTLHGVQSLLPAQRKTPLSYYGASSGAGLVFAKAPGMFGSQARIGVVGLGGGSLACYAHPGQNWTFFEIDPVVWDYSRDGTFTFISDCTPKARVIIGDARLELAKMPGAGFDVLAVDAFSSDSIPLHLLTKEAIGIYTAALAQDGVLLIHISNRFMRLEPAIAALAKDRGLSAQRLLDRPKEGALTRASLWIALSRQPATLGKLTQAGGDRRWQPLTPPEGPAWTDDHASILPYILWQRLLSQP